MGHPTEILAEGSAPTASLHDKDAVTYHTEAKGQVGLVTEEDEAFLRDYPEDKKKKALRKVDYRLIPLLTLLYLFSFIDRANIGNAKIEGLVTDLGLTNAQYNTCLSIFFVPYVLLEVPSNYVLNRFRRPSVYMGCIVIAWGTVMTMAGVVQNFAGLITIRFFLGVTEAGFFPGAVLIISKWYLPNETQTRIALFYTASALAGAFSGLLAAGIAQMDGVGGLEGWRWIFLLEGIATVLAGIATYFCMIDSPELSSKWLDSDEIRYLSLRQRADASRRAAATRKNAGLDRKALVSVLTDWQIYAQALIYWSNTVPNNALKFTMPQIIRNMGYKSTQAQLLTVPPYIVGALSAYGSAIFADRFKWRMPFIVVPQALVVIAYSILTPMAVDIRNNIAPCYFSIMLACVGLYPINPGGNAWTLNNLAGPTKRAMGIAYMISLGNAGGVVGSYIFIESESPRYPTGFGTSLAFALAGILAALTLEFVYTWVNKKRDQLTEEEIRDKYTDEELESMGDRSPLFRYSL